ncbi:uncharacterized protein VTP21DRAFT_5589 [Calcarisporiella thermophila]|uniref:uncharacterized protein n=1 Tax=Calcarisporiella thermophila TaxID=911321 RepID=UPI0037437F97
MSLRMLSRYSIRFSSTLSRPMPIPIGDKEAQREFEELVRQNMNQTDSEGKHPDAKEALPEEFEGDRNPATGEIGGPKQEPLKHGDWSFSGKVTDF